MFKLHSFIPFIHWILAPLFGLFAAGGDALGALGGSDAAVIDSGAESVDDFGDVTSETETALEGAEGEEGATEVKPDADKPLAANQKATGRELVKPLSGAERKALAVAKEADPVAWKELNKRIYALDGLDRKLQEHFPEGGLKSAIELKTSVDSLVSELGARGLDGIREEINDFRNTDAKIIKGDPSFIESLPAEAQESIFGMMPHFIGEWGQRYPEAYEHMFSGIVANTLRDKNLMDNSRYALRELERMGLENVDVKAVYDLIKANDDWMRNLQEAANKPLQKKAAATQVPDELKAREERVAQAERNASMSRVGQAATEHGKPKMLSTLRGIYGGKIPPNVNIPFLFEKARYFLSLALGPGFSTTVGGYLDSRDEEGAKKYVRQQLTDTRLSEAVSKANKFIYGQPALGSKRGGGAHANGRTRAEGAPAKDQGFTKIAFNPKAQSVDYRATDVLAAKLGLTRARLLAQNKCVLKGGKQVSWADGAPGED